MITHINHGYHHYTTTTTSSTNHNHDIPLAQLSPYSPLQYYLFQCLNIHTCPRCPHHHQQQPLAVVVFPASWPLSLSFSRMAMTHPCSPSVEPASSLPSLLSSPLLPTTPYPLSQQVRYFNLVIFFVLFLLSPRHPSTPLVSP